MPRAKLDTGLQELRMQRTVEYSIWIVAKQQIAYGLSGASLYDNSPRLGNHSYATTCHLVCSGLIE